MRVTISHVDTCYPEYLTDHHNRDGECLVGLYLANQSEEDAVNDLVNEVNSADWGIPDGISDEEIRAAAVEGVKGVDLRPVNEDGNRVAEFDCDFEQPQAWFLMTLEV